jgi:predicted metal-binding protein
MGRNDQLIHLALASGAFKAQVVAVKDIPFNAVFRKMCEMNSCGKYGKSWMCPPEVGDIDTLIAEAQSFFYALVYQTVSPLEDSFDIEGMLAAGERHNQLVARISEQIAEFHLARVLHLGAGGCGVCDRCSKLDDQPCRYPEQAMSSLEAYGISVSELAVICGMKYINGPNTVTYFGALFFEP